jgi:hypothetical protein
MDSHICQRRTLQCILFNFHDFRPVFGTGVHPVNHIQCTILGSPSSGYEEFCLVRYVYNNMQVLRNTTPKQSMVTRKMNCISLLRIEYKFTLFRCCITTTRTRFVELEICEKGSRGYEVFPETFMLQTTNVPPRQECWVTSTN